MQEENIPPTAAIQYEELLDSLSPQQLEAIHSLIDSYGEAFNKAGHPFRGLMILYGITDYENRTSIPEASCKAGCAHCCSIRVIASELETDLIVHHCRQHDIPIDHKKLEQLQDLTTDEYMFSLHKRCTFLDENNRCKIYAVRPFSCRNYFVTSPPDDCNTDTNPHGYVKGLMNLPASLPAVAIMGNYKIDSFPKLLLKSLNKI